MRQPWDVVFDNDIETLELAQCTGDELEEFHSPGCYLDANLIC